MIFSEAIVVVENTNERDTFAIESKKKKNITIKCVEKVLGMLSILHFIMFLSVPYLLHSFAIYT